MSLLAQILTRAYLISLCFSPLWANSSILTVKPFFQFNHDFDDTYGVEVGYWPHKAFPHTDIYLGYDAGLLSSISNLEVYADTQLGSRFIGMAGGVYVIADDGWHTGLQFSGWINIFAGFNYRLRYNPLDPMGSASAFYIAVPLLLKDTEQ